MQGHEDEGEGRAIDVDASLFRMAIAERSVEPVELSGAEMQLLERRCVLAHVGDGGPRPNALWSEWVRATRTQPLERVRARLGELEVAGQTAPRAVNAED